MEIDYTDFSWHVVPPADRPRKDQIAYYKESKHWRHVMPQTVNRWRKFVPSRKIVKKELGKNVEELSNEELAKFIVARLQDKADKESAALGVARSVVGKQHGHREAKVDDLLAEYLKHYDARTPNDLDSLKQLCYLKLAIEDLQKTERIMLTTLKDPTKKGQVSEAYINSIVNARLKYLGEYRQLQTMLGIDRPTRDKAESEAGGLDYMHDLMVRTNELLKTKTVQIRCPKCKENGTILQMGFVLCHFGGWEFRVPCPRCKELIYLNSPAERSVSTS